MYVGYIAKGFNWIGQYDVNPIRDSRNSSNCFEKHFLGIWMYVGCIAKGFNWIGHYDVNPIRG